MSTSPPYLVTYAQNREDLYLWALLGHRPQGIYVDVGCNHERLHSVTRLFYERGWSGLNVDANPAFGAEYARRARDTFVAAGVAAEPGELTLRIYDRGDGLSTFDEYTKGEHEAAGLKYRELSVPVRTLTQLLDEAAIRCVDFLKVDVEGMEPEVLRGLDFARFRPAVIVIEAARLDDCVDLLGPLDYRIEFFDGLNTYFVDDAANDIDIHHYAARVLSTGFRTDLEHTLLRRPLARLRSQLGRAAGSMRRLARVIAR